MNLPADSNNLKPSRELLIQVDEIGKITAITPNCYDILGFTESELINTYIYSHLGYDLDSLLSHTNIQTSMQKKDGEKLFFNLAVTPLIKDNYKIIGAKLSLIDISKYVQLEEYCNQFKKIFEKTKDIIFTFQIIPEQKFLYLSNSIMNILGYDADAHFKNPNLVFELTHPDDIEIINAKMDKHSDFSKPFCVRFKHRDGHYIWIEDYIIPNFDENGNLISVSGISRDITDKKKLEEKLQEKNRALEIDVITEIETNKIMEKTLKAQEQLFVNISHELKTPLNIISSTAQLLSTFYNNKSLCNDKATFTKYINSITLNCYRLSKLINNIVDMSKIEAGFFQLNLSNQNIVEVVEEIVMSVTNFTELKGLNIIFDTDIEEKIIACDPEKIERIVLNLISNAIKFSDSGDEIFISVKDMKEFIEISVKDNGIGIETKHLASIFDRFKQVDKSLCRNAEGAGIGLSLVKSIVELHGGTISVESEYGKGSKFIVVLPARAISEQHTLFERSLNHRNENIKVEFSDVYS